MRIRQKTHRHLYPRWSKKDSPSKQVKARDGNQCVFCQVADRTLILDEQGQPSHMLYLHAGHLHPLDPWFERIEPIDGQRMRAMCPHCHGIYDTHWKKREEEVEHQRCLHGILCQRWLLSRFLQVI